MQAPIHRLPSFFAGCLWGGFPVVLWLWADNRAVLHERRSWPWKLASLSTAMLLGVLLGWLLLHLRPADEQPEAGRMVPVEILLLADRAAAVVLTLVALRRVRDVGRLHPPLPPKQAVNVVLVTLLVSASAAGVTLLLRRDLL